ncbi:unnamed protein product [Nezara viridula]|uniref:Uncharacterized protein n=1 Tax=Nezara viridula TaxID=85310 RepID=A0A9P0MMS5_NEZVI|nr:unnamed protein product [Nezara viridula]
MGLPCLPAANQRVPSGLTSQRPALAGHPHHSPPRPPSPTPQGIILDLTLCQKRWTTCRYNLFPFALEKLWRQLAQVHPLGSMPVITNGLDKGWKGKRNPPPHLFLNL